MSVNVLVKIRHIDLRRLAIQDAEEKIRRLKKEMSSMTIDIILNEDNPDDKQDLANILYWEFEDYIPAKAIAVGCGCNHISHILKSVISPYEVIMSCSDCKKDYAHKYTSRSSKVGGTYPLCPSCNTTREKRLDRLHRRIQRDMRDAENETSSFQMQVGIQGLRSMPYKEYLQTDHWKNTRKKAQERANYRCQLCNTKKQTLHVHHRTYERRGQEYASDLIVLCANCHETFHNHSELDNDQ